MDILLKLNSEGTTVVMVTHDEQEAPRRPHRARVRRPAGRLRSRMFKNYLLTAWKVFMRRKLFTAINLLCIVLTLVVLMVSPRCWKRLLPDRRGRQERALPAGV
jgi:ABC-type sulfate/molybdate transport systems ATPase subunit